MYDYVSPIFPSFRIDYVSWRQDSSGHIISRTWIKGVGLVNWVRHPNLQGRLNDRMRVYTGCGTLRKRVAVTAVHGWALDLGNGWQEQTVYTWALDTHSGIGAFWVYSSEASGVAYTNSLLLLFLIY